TGQSVACPSALNQLALGFGDASLGAHVIQGLSFVLAADSVTVPPGTFDPSSGLFNFPVASGTPFDGAATMDESPSVFPLEFDEAEFGALDPRSGDFAVGFSLVGLLGDQPVQMSGVAISSKVVDFAPVITAPAAMAIDANAGCSATVTLAASASSPT